MCSLLSVLFEKIKQHKNINTTSKSFEVLWNAGRCYTIEKLSFSINDLNHVTYAAGIHNSRK